MLSSKVKTIVQQYKSNFYQKSLQIKTDFSLYNKYFKQWHGRYFDVIRRTKYESENRDYRKLKFNTQDPLFFDHAKIHLNGGIQRLVDTIQREPDFILSPYRCIYLMYNMAKVDYLNKEFFTRLDNILNTSLLDEEMLISRYPYGALYSYYKFNQGRPENIAFFEREMPDFIDDFHYFETLDLLNAMSDSKLYPREHFDHQFKVYLKESLTKTFDREFAHRQTGLLNLAYALKKFGTMDEVLWDKWTKRVVDIKRVQNLEDYDKFLKLLLWLNEYPKSPKFGSISSDIEKFKDKIKSNPNRYWKYDPDKASFRTFDELLKTREEIDETYEIGKPKISLNKEKEKISIEHKDEMTAIKDLFNEMLADKVNITDMISHFNYMGFNTLMVDEIISNYVIENQKKIAEKMKLEGKFDKPIKVEKKKRKVAAPPGKGDAKAAAGGKKK